MQIADASGLGFNNMSMYVEKRLSAMLNVRIAPVNPCCAVTPWHRVQKRAPMRVGAMIVCQQNFMFSSLWAMVKPFVGQKMRDRMHFVGRDSKAMSLLVEPQHVSRRSLVFHGVR